MPSSRFVLFCMTDIVYAFRIIETPMCHNLTLHQPVQCVLSDSASRSSVASSRSRTADPSTQLGQ
ncbi:hypothetical protein M758_12G141000 [Ceratodon purpureus]|uniref:Uncharacterized protein n=1 Tax=Ceratodon purpureus TaxID=3225 RepID=A0A8T0GA64_CERPU|nr:hypothetical protein KC19_11G024600 [Ceratodon purpureus]KAG0599295.1 hypothetical protein M758_12G141000 [Ceratodon purpureus]